MKDNFLKAANVKMNNGDKAALERLVEKFANHQIEQDACIARGDTNTGNLHVQKMLECFDRLVEHGDIGRDALGSLLAHENPSVKCTAAAFLLRYKHEEALAVLNELADRPELGFVSLCAKTSIENWNCGDWELDPE